MITMCIVVSKSQINSSHFTCSQKKDKWIQKSTVVKPGSGVMARSSSNEGQREFLFG